MINYWIKIMGVIILISPNFSIVKNPKNLQSNMILDKKSLQKSHQQPTKQVEKKQIKQQKKKLIKVIDPTTALWFRFIKKIIHRIYSMVTNYPLIGAGLALPLIAIIYISFYIGQETEKNKKKTIVLPKVIGLLKEDIPVVNNIPVVNDFCTIKIKNFLVNNISNNDTQPIQSLFGNEIFSIINEDKIFPLIPKKNPLYESIKYEPLGLLKEGQKVFNILIEIIETIEHINIERFINAMTFIKNTYPRHFNNFFNYSFQYILFHYFANKGLALGLFLENLLDDKLIKHEDYHDNMAIIAPFIFSILNMPDELLFKYGPHLNMALIPWSIFDRLKSQQTKRLGSLIQYYPNNDKWVDGKKIFFNFSGEKNN
jgi:hypothetical protein